jgi:hypothetical protein
MIDYHDGVFLAMWKNGPESEDKDGQRILYSQSSDGETWSATNGNNVMFPSLSTNEQASAMFIGPPIKINGRVYVGASPGIPTDAAAGAQYCLWPDPINPRNCGPPKFQQQVRTLVMREVFPGMHTFGPLFWAANEVPTGWEKATAQYGLKTVNEMDAQTQGDVATLTAQETGTARMVWVIGLHSRVPAGPMPACAKLLHGCGAMACLSDAFFSDISRHKIPAER